MGLLARLRSTPLRADSWEGCRSCGWRIGHVRGCPQSREEQTPPPESCYLCGDFLRGVTFWRRDDGPAVCEVCIRRALIREG